MNDLDESYPLDEPPIFTTKRKSLSILTDLQAMALHYRTIRDLARLPKVALELESLKKDFLYCIGKM